MKTNFKSIVFVLVCIFALAIQSCKSDKDNEPTKNDIIGTWKLTEVSTNDGSTFSSWPFVTTTATFNDNGTYSGKGYFGDGSGTWKQSGKTILTYIDGDEFYRYEIKELTSSTCTLVMSSKRTNTTIWIKCIKTSGGSDGGMTEISKSELESVTSFECNDNGDMIYLKFRDGHIYTKEITSSGMVCNEDDITYILSGNKISMEFYNQKPSGTIYKVKFNDGKIGIVMELEGTFGIATWLSKTFKQSEYKF